jgi:RNA polymerase sigma-70 factor (ECF subfamily)
MTVSDEELLKTYLSGDESGFSGLVNRYRGLLFTVILRMVRDHGEAEDIFQETFYRVLRHADRFDFDRKFSTWVYSIAANLCRDRLRRRKSTPVEGGIEVSGFSGSDDPERDSWRGEVREAVERALTRLPDEQREVFVLREYGEMSFKEIAEATKSNLNTVLGRMRLAVKKLRAELADFMEVGA